MFDDFLGQEDLCYTLMHEIGPKIRLEDFEDMYREGGRPPISPKILVMVLILQFLERLTDRAAAQNLKFRLDWKIALGLEVDNPGIHPTTLVKFRDRLIANKKAQYAFDKVLECLVDHGFVKKGARQRIDSTHIVAKVRELSRLELFHETLRLFFESVGDFEDEMPKFMKDLAEYYTDSVSTRGISDSQKNKFFREAGIAMKAIIAWASEGYPEITTLKSYQCLKSVFEQNFIDSDPDPDGPKMVKVATGRDHICSPHESDARYASKGDKKWLGYKAQISETIAEEGESSGFITFAEFSESTGFDGDVVSDYIEEQESKDICPDKVYGDCHYNTEENIKNLAQRNIDLCGPVHPASTKIAPKNQGFQIDQENRCAICPKGKISQKFSTMPDGRVCARFSKNDCQICPRKDICRPNPRGKQIEVRPPNPVLSSRRKEMETEAFQEEMFARNGIEGTISGLTRGQNLRHSRFRGAKKTRLHIKFCAAAANLLRFHQRSVREAKAREVNAA